MKPLVLYCRWHGASLRLRGRDQTAVWGHLVFSDDDANEVERPFRFDLQSWWLTFENEEGDEQALQLDEMGVVLNA